MVHRHRAAGRRSRRVLTRLGTVATAVTIGATVLASTVTAAPTLPGWLLLPLEASGMPAHLTTPLTVTTSPERAEITISLADHVAARETTKAPVAPLAASEPPVEKVAPAPLVAEESVPVAVPEGESPVLVPDDGELTVPQVEETTEPVPAETPEPEVPDQLPAVVLEPEPEPEPEPSAPAAPEPAPTTPEALADGLAAMVGTLTGELRTLTVARYALFMEAARDPALQAEIGRGAERVAEIGRRWLTAAGSLDPEAHTWLLLAHLDGVVVHRLAFPDARSGEVAEGLRTLLGALLP